MEDTMEDTFDMKNIEKILGSVVLSYSEGMSRDTVDNIFYYYVQQIERLKMSLKMDKFNVLKKKQLENYISALIQLSNENSHMKYNDIYINSISKKI